MLISFRTTKDNLNTAMNEKVLSSVEYYSNTIEKDIQGIQNYLDALNMLLKFDLDRKISEGDTLIKNKLELLTKEYNLEAAYLYLKPEYFGKEHVFNYEKSLGVYSRLVITSYSIHYTKLYDTLALSRGMRPLNYTPL